VQNQFTTTGSISAASAIARGTFLNQTLVATANNDVLVGLDVSPTFNTAGFANVQQVSIRVNSTIQPSTSAGASLGSPSFNFNQGHIRQFASSGPNGFEFYPSYLTKSGQWFNTGNLLLQNGGTFTDITSARLAVNSTTQGFLPPRMTTTQKNAIASPAVGLVVYDTTLNKLCVRGASAWETITSV
jgi:hypothetical protein